MSAYLLVTVVGAAVLLGVWQWDERARRAALRRRRELRRLEISRQLHGASGQPAATGGSVSDAPGAQAG